MELPDYINCDNENIEHCEYFLTNACQSTCAYARDIGGIGIGATVNPVGLEGEVNDTIRD